MAIEYTKNINWQKDINVEKEFEKIKFFKAREEYIDFDQEKYFYRLFQIVDILPEKFQIESLIMKINLDSWGVVKREKTNKKYKFLFLHYLESMPRLFIEQKHNCILDNVNLYQVFGCLNKNEVEILDFTE